MYLNNVVGLSKILNSESFALTFASDGKGNVYVAGSGNTKYNPTISLPENYKIEMGKNDKSYYVQNYEYLLTEECINSMQISEQISDEVANELKNLSNAIERTKQEAEKAIISNPSKPKDEQISAYIYNIDKNKQIFEYTFEKGRTVSNCGEIWASREAILNGIKFEDLELSTYCNIEKELMK